MPEHIAQHILDFFRLGDVLSHIDPFKKRDLERVVRRNGCHRAIEDGDIIPFRLIGTK